MKKEIRDQETKRKSKYNVIVLPEKPDGHVGYHPSCYKFFCSIKSKKQETISESESKRFVL